MSRRKSLVAADKRKNTINKKYDSIKEKIRARKENPKPIRQPNDELGLKVRDMADEFEEANAVYKGRFIRVFDTRIESGSNAYILLKRAVTFADKLEVPYDVYVKGIFYTCDKYWNRAATIKDLAAYRTKITSEDMVRQYLADIEENKSVSTARVVAPARNIEIPKRVSYRQSEVQLRKLMHNYNMSEEEIIEKFCGGLYGFLYFDKDWLLSNETYCRLKEEGRV